MKVFARSRACVAIAVLVAVAMPLQAAATEMKYAVQLLGDFFSNGAANAINNRGEVAGVSGGGAFFYSPNGGVSYLGPLGGSSPTNATAINALGQLAGYASGIDDTSILYTPSTGGQPNPIRVSEGWSTHRATGINDAGVVVGYGHTIFRTDTRGYVYDPQLGLRWLEPYSGGDQTGAYAINNKGQIAGYSNGPFPNDIEAVIFDGDGVHRLGFLPGAGAAGRPYSLAWDINDAGQVIGISSTTAADRYQSFIYQAETGMQPIPGLAGMYGGFAAAAALNNLGWIVGAQSPQYAGSYDARGFIYTPDDGTRSLTDLLAPESRGWIILAASDINDHGQIAATAARIGMVGSYPVLLTPVPEPGALSLLVLGLSVLVLFARPRRRL